MENIVKLVEKMKNDGVLHKTRSWTDKKYKELYLVGEKTDKKGNRIVLDAEVKDYDKTGEKELTWGITIYTRKGLTANKEKDYIIVDSLNKVEEKIREIYGVKKEK